MTVIRLDHTDQEVKADSGVWNCRVCGCVHMRAEGVLVTFAPDEFAAFTKSVVDCHWERELLAVEDGQR